MDAFAGRKNWGEWGDQVAHTDSALLRRGQLCNGVMGVGSRRLWSRPGPPRNFCPTLETLETLGNVPPAWPRLATSSLFTPFLITLKNKQKVVGLVGSEGGPSNSQTCCSENEVALQGPSLNSKSCGCRGSPGWRRREPGS